MIPRAPNLYELRRGATCITYSASGIDGKPRLHFEDGERQLDFVGDQLAAEESEIGRLVTVELSFVPDGETRILSVLLPEVRTMKYIQSSARKCGYSAYWPGPMLVTRILSPLRRSIR